jgi:hypothetical protein
MYATKILLEIDYLLTVINDWNAQYAKVMYCWQLPCLLLLKPLYFRTREVWAAKEWSAVHCYLDECLFRSAMWEVLRHKNSITSVVLDFTLWQDRYAPVQQIQKFKNVLEVLSWCMWMSKVFVFLLTNRKIYRSIPLYIICLI